MIFGNNLVTSNVNSVYFILTSTEFKFDSTLIGFEIYASQSSTINLDVNKFFYSLITCLNYFFLFKVLDFGDSCLDQCSLYLLKSLNYKISLNKIYSFTIQIRSGLNQYSLTSKYKIAKKSIIGMENPGYNVIKIQQVETSYTDFYLDNRNRIYQLSTNFMIRGLITTQFYFKQFNIFYSYLNYSDYALTARFNLSSYGIKSVTKVFQLISNIFI